MKLYLPLWSLNELIYVFRKIIEPARRKDSGEPEASAADAAAGWKEFLKERENCKNPFESVMPAFVDHDGYNFGGEDDARMLTERRITLRFFVWGGVPQTVYSWNALPNMWPYILSSNILSGQVLERLYLNADSSVMFSLKQDDADDSVVTHVITKSDDPLTSYEWLKGTMFKASSEYSRFLMDDTFKRHGWLKEVGERLDDAAAFERLRKYLAGSGSALIEENARLKRTVADMTEPNEEQLRVRALMEENTRLKRTVAEWELGRKSEGVGLNER